MALDKVHYATGIGFMVANVMGQFLFGMGARQTVLLVIGLFIHLIASGLVGFSLIMLAQTVLSTSATSMSRPLGPNQGGMDVDMVIAYSLFAFTGFALTCVAVFLREGSFYWNFFTILLGALSAFASDPAVRAKLKRNVPKALSGEDDGDDWSAAPATAPSGMRHRM